MLQILVVFYAVWNLLDTVYYYTVFTAQGLKHFLIFNLILLHMGIVKKRVIFIQFGLTLNKYE